MTLEQFWEKMDDTQASTEHIRDYIKSQISEEHFQLMRTILKSMMQTLPEQQAIGFSKGFTSALIIKQMEAAEQLQEMLEKLQLF